jgi:hypothetical protein
MILELAEYLLTPCSRAFRRVGYLRGQLGIKVRYRQCRVAWRPHLELTKVAILSAAQECAQRRKCLILGSGRLLDVPLHRLSQMFREVILVDAVHPLIAYATAVWYRNVRLVRADVTETAEELTRVAKRPDLPLPQATPCQFCDDQEIDYVASVNLMSQLSYLPGLYLEKENRPEEDVEQYSRSLMTAHLEYLQRLPGIVSLITDVEKLVLDKNGKVIERIDILHGVKLPWTGEQWTWKHVPLNLVSRDYAYDRRVFAIQDIKKAKPDIGPTR